MKTNKIELTPESNEIKELLVLAENYRFIWQILDTDEVTKTAFYQDIQKATHLVLSNFNFEDNDLLSVLFEISGISQTLRTFEINSNKAAFYSARIKQIFTPFPASVDTLIMTDCNLRNALESLSLYLKNSTNLRCIKLGNKISLDGTEPIENFIQLPSLQKLDLLVTYCKDDTNIACKDTIKEHNFQNFKDTMLVVKKLVLENHILPEIGDCIMKIGGSLLIDFSIEASV